MSQALKMGQTCQSGSCPVSTHALTGFLCHIIGKIVIKSVILRPPCPCLCLILIFHLSIHELCRQTLVYHVDLKLKAVMQLIDAACLADERQTDKAG